MNRDEIAEKVIECIRKKFSLQLDEHIVKGYSLLDPRIGFTPRDLLVLFMELQKIFDICFIEEDVIEKRFDYLDNIVYAIEKKVIMA